MAVINDRECSNKYLGKEQLIIGIAVLNNQECENYLLELQRKLNTGIDSQKKSNKYL